MTGDNYMRELVYGLLREEEKKKAPPREYAPPKASDLVASARKIMAQHRCAIDPTWIKCRRWTCLEAAWLALGIDPNLTDPWRLDRDWRPGLTPIAEDLARRLSRLVGEAGAPTDFIQVMTDLGIRSDWLDTVEPVSDLASPLPDSTIVESPATAGRNPDDSDKKEQRMEAIRGAFADLGYHILNPPYGGMKQIKNRLEKSHPKLFTPKSFGKNCAFDDAWRALRESEEGKAP